MFFTLFEYHRQTFHLHISFSDKTKMSKSIRLSQNKDGLHDLDLDDRLSRFPDDVLVVILSFLPLKDAAITSKLSKRWRYVWQKTQCLNFEDEEMGNEPMDVVEKNKFIDWVNDVIGKHKSPTLDEFTICFDLDKNAKGAIDNWIDFAISKKVQTLELDLKDSSSVRKRKNYVFPNEIVDTLDMKFLKTLILSRVNLNDEGLEKILTNCPVLEDLSIRGSMNTVNAKIYGTELALKNLEIIYCESVQCIEICDSNIVSLNFYGTSCTLILDDLPKLETMSLASCVNSWRRIDYLLCCIPSIQVLELQTYHPQENMGSLSLPELPNLKQLVMIVGVVGSKAWDDGSLSVLTSLVEASPNLRRFIIKLKTGWTRDNIRNWEIRQVAKQPHQHLEVVKIFGYLGRTSDFELAMHFIENGSVALKKLVIKPGSGNELGLGTNEINEKKIASRHLAEQQLKPKTPVGVELVIL